MKEIAVGIAFIWLISMVSRKGISVKGLPSILFMLFIAWGLGSIFFAVVK